jgi:NAD/NADP transhydrogenase beta subunit
MKIRRGYAAAALLLLAIELAIAAFLHGGLVRTHVGDGLAVILVFASLMALLHRLRPVPAILLSLAIAVAIELAQGIHLLARIGLAGHPVTEAMLGTSFDGWDLIAYGAGAALVFAIERARHRPASQAVAARSAASPDAGSSGRIGPS